VGADELIAAFFEGLDLDAVELSPAQSAALFRQVGRLLRLLTQSTIEVLHARSALKSEFRLSQTIVGPLENNPLKFSSHADQALRQFFVDARPGFMGAEAAFSEALKDIKQHEIAVVAGMRAAFDCLLKKLAPDTVEAAYKASGKRGSMLPFGDKTWDFYQQFYADFKANAGDDFQGIFGKDFVRAYEEQIALLRSRENVG
jgi:type VI secretion system protein